MWTLLRAPNAEIYAIDVSFSHLKDKEGAKYLNKQPTSFTFPARRSTDCAPPPASN
jgi:NTE family protein